MPSWRDGRGRESTQEGWVDQEAFQKGRRILRPSRSARSGQEALPECQERSGGPPRVPGGDERGREALQERQEELGRPGEVGKGWEVLQEGQEGIAGPSGGLGGVGRDRRGRESIVEGRENQEAFL